MCYTYDELSRVRSRTEKNTTTDEVISTETYTYDAASNITDAPDCCFAYDTYGKCISRTGTTDVIFGYNGKYGVVTDKNGLIYMRARYYSPDMRRFINADIIPGKISNAVTLNRYAYANGNPVSFTDPFGLSALEWISDKWNRFDK